MKPTIGRIVHYSLTSDNVLEITRRRVAKPHEAGWPAGAQAHVGNAPSVGQHVPMIVCVVWNSEGVVNGQAFLDGNDVLWITSAKEGTEPGTWAWPERI
jgi:phospholipase C